MSHNYLNKLRTQELISTIKGYLGNISTVLTGLASGDARDNTKAPLSHTQASNTINAMTGYGKPGATSAITASDTLNQAIGKLEKADDDIIDSIDTAFERSVHITTPAELQALVRSGRHLKVLRHGDTFVVDTVTGTSSLSSLAFKVIGIDKDTPADTTKTHCLTLKCTHPFGHALSREALLITSSVLTAGSVYRVNVPQLDHFYSSSGYLYFLVEDEYEYTASSALEAGPYNYEHGNTTYLFTLTHDVPAGGKLRRYRDVYVKSYDSSNNLIETVRTSVGSPGWTVLNFTELDRDIPIGSKIVLRVKFPQEVGDQGIKLAGYTVILPNGSTRTASDTSVYEFTAVDDQNVTVLGTADGNTPGINIISRAIQGEGIYSKSNAYEWMNSSLSAADREAAWTNHGNDFAIKPTVLGNSFENGFLYQLDPAFVAILGEVKKTNIEYNLDGTAVVRESNDKVFIESYAELTGVTEPYAVVTPTGGGDPVIMTEGSKYGYYDRFSEEGHAENGSPRKTLLRTCTPGDLTPVTYGISQRYIHEERAYAFPCVCVV